MRDVYRVASELRQRHHQPGERVTYTHVPSALEPAEALELLRKSSLHSMLAEDGAPLTHPERPWYRPTAAIAATESALNGVGVTASTWGPPSRDFVSAELALWLSYGHEDASAQQRLELHATDEKTTFTRVFYDEQRAATGYEGDDRVTWEPSQVQIEDFLRIIQAATDATEPLN